MKCQILQCAGTTSCTFFYCRHPLFVTAYFLFFNDKNLEDNLLRELMFEQCAEWTALQLRMFYLSAVLYPYICLKHEKGVNVPQIHLIEFLC
jgi:hypothetical protein